MDKFKAFWASSLGLMLAGCLCGLLGGAVAIWATSDVSIKISVTPRPCTPSCQPVAPVTPAPAPLCPCKPKKPGDPGPNFEAGTGCECPPGDCHCHPGVKGGVAAKSPLIEHAILTQDHEVLCWLRWVYATAEVDLPVALQEAKGCGCPSCDCYPCKHEQVNGKCACPGCNGKGKYKCCPN